MRAVVPPVKPERIRSTFAAIQPAEEAFTASEAAELFRQLTEGHFQYSLLLKMPWAYAVIKPSVA